MLDQLPAQKADALLALIKMHAADQRDDTIDLGVGVYKTDDGDTPVFRAVKAAERQLLDQQSSKSYLGPEGDTGFVTGLMPYIFGNDPDAGGRIAGMQTPGGTGAVRLAVALASAAGVTKIHLGTPSWPNHAQILNDVGVEIATFDHATDQGTADIDRVLQIIDTAGEGEAVLLHSCCHNPTGIDYTNADWDRIAAAFKGSKALPILDSAYQGLGRGMQEDAYGLRAVAAQVDEALIAYSCDKNFGMYRDRVGAFYVLAKDADGLDAIMSNANALARANWSMPPDHGGAAVRHVLDDSQLTQQWLDELADMRGRMRAVRSQLAAAGTAGTIDLRPLGKQNGLFAMLPLTGAQIEALREDHGIYMAGSGRINVAGLHSGNIGKFIEALSAVSS